MAFNGDSLRSPSCVDQCEVSPNRKREPLDPHAARSTIFVVDDNVDAADSLTDVLRLMGHSVKTFYEGASAAAAAATDHPDVAVMDLGMPGMDGFAAATLMQHSTPQTLLVACSGWGGPQDRQRSKAAGFTHHLTKPSPMSELNAILRARQITGLRC